MTPNESNRPLFSDAPVADPSTEATASREPSAATAVGPGPSHGETDTPESAPPESDSPESAPIAVDRAAGIRLWEDYAAARPAAVAASPEYTIESFGDSERLADELLGHVLTGRKRATSELVADFLSRGDDVPRIGSHWVACDGRGVPRIVIRSTELRIGPFATADEAFAADEGEDDLSLESWRHEHRRYWTRVSAAQGREWSEDEEIVFERFAVVWPPELAD